MHEILKELLDCGVFRYHEIKVIQVCGLRPVHESVEDCEESIELLVREELFNNSSELLVEMLLVLWWNFSSSIQLDYFSHRDGLLRLFLKLVLYD